MIVVDTDGFFRNGALSVEHSYLPERLKEWRKSHPNNTMTSQELGDILRDEIEGILMFSHTVWRMWNDLGQPTGMTDGTLSRFKTITDVIRCETAHELLKRAWGPATRMLHEHGITLRYQVQLKSSLSTYLTANGG